MNIIENVNRFFVQNDIYYNISNRSDHRPASAGGQKSTGPDGLLLSESWLQKYILQSGGDDCLYYNVMDIARYIINYAHKTKQSISNLKLQKLLYYVQAAFLISDREHVCFRDVILSWRHGPVIRRVYDEYSRYGAGEIPYQSSYQKIALVDGRLRLKRETFTDQFLSEDDAALIDRVLDGLLPYDAWYLVDRTHEEEPWKALPCYNEEITPESIQEYFNVHSGRIYGKFDQ